ncbi:MAG TPA: diguanylate cyclase [Casimicrobiaceae bacterium]|nr:diguanylate cyclase [Casimicrobiaceae bacterium]
MDRIELSRLARIVWPYIALWLVLAAAVVGFAAYELGSNRNADLAAGRAEAENLARIMSEHMQQTLDSTDRMLTLFKLAREHRMSAQSLETLSTAMKPMQGTEAERRVNFFDRDGQFVTSTDRKLAGRAASIADRAYFHRARNGSDRELFIGDAVMGRLSLATVIPVAKRVKSVDGEFDGVVVTALDPQRLVQLFRSLRVGERSSVGIAHRDGPVLAWAQATRTDARAPESIGEIVQADRIIALSAVHGTELLAFASLSEHELLSTHRRVHTATLAFAALTIAACTLPIWWVGAHAWREVHQRRLLERRFANAHAQARTDSLTGLANRTGFDEARRAMYDKLKRDGTPFALAFVDIDHFKRLNDSLGHEAGDNALRAVAETLTGGVRQSDVVGRLGGDEFAVLMPGVTAETMHRRFDPIKIDLDNMVRLNGWRISFSIGVVACESATPRSRDAVNLADRMMYDAKGAGRDGIRYAVFRNGRLFPEDREDAAAQA